MNNNYFEYANNKKSVVFVYNTAMYLYRFRRELIMELKKMGWNVIALTPNDAYVEKIKELGVDWHHLPLESHSMELLKELKLFFFMLKFFLKVKPSIVFNFTIKPVLFGSIAAHLAGVPKICSMVAGLGYLIQDTSLKVKLIKLLFIPLYKLALSLNNHIFVQNTDDRAFLEHSLKINLNKITNIDGSGVDINTFKPDPLAVKSKIVFICVARLLWQKGIGEYIDAAKILHKKYSNSIEFQLLGMTDTSPDSIPLSYVNNWHNSGIINYLGSTDDVRPFLNKASVFVLPSHREGRPRSAIEALAMGLPVITSEAPGCREVIVNGLNGLLVPTKDHVLLANAMERFIINPDLIIKMGNDARRFACDKYDVNKIVQTIITTILCKS